jgi:hypothetical protein
MQNTIFVQIASYRDPELRNTLDDMFQMAKYPKNLRVCVAWQHGDDETSDMFNTDYKNNLHILDIPYVESKGVCWARNQIQQHYNGEVYTLQLDSHHRFVEHWDAKLIKMLKSLQRKGYEKPLLTAYAPAYVPATYPEGKVESPWWMQFDRFIPEGAVFFLPANIPGYEKLTEPIPARFYSAHFAFTVGQFAQEVQHDPNMYFHGEEISIAVRAFTYGYDLFHPHEVIVWHEYTRSGRTKQWDDDKTWYLKNTESHKRNRILFGIEPGCTPCMRNQLEPYVFGNVRTLDDYEKYAGIRFSDRSVQQYTLDHKFAPNPVIEDTEEYNKSFSMIFKHCIDIQFSQVPEKDYQFWVVAFHDEKDNTLYRQDANKDEILRILKDSDGYGKIWRTFNTTTKPTHWVVWPFSERKGWCERITGNLF